MRAGDQAHVFQVRHDVTDRGWRQIKPGKFRQRPRADRLTVGDVPFDEGFEQGLGAGIELHAGILSSVTVRGQRYPLAEPMFQLIQRGAGCVGCDV